MPISHKWILSMARAIVGFRHSGQGKERFSRRGAGNAEEEQPTQNKNNVYKHLLIFLAFFAPLREIKCL